MGIIYLTKTSFHYALAHFWLHWGTQKCISNADILLEKHQQDNNKISFTNSILTRGPDWMSSKTLLLSKEICSLNDWTGPVYQLSARSSYPMTQNRINFQMLWSQFLENFFLRPKGEHGMLTKIPAFSESPFVSAVLASGH